MLAKPRKATIVSATTASFDNPCMVWLSMIHYLLLAKMIFEEIKKEMRIKHALTLKTCRERIQHWLVNGKFARFVLKYIKDYKLDDGSGECLLQLWAEKMLESSKEWKATALDLEDILTWIQLDTILINLCFEAELVKYFEVTYNWHASPGELSTRPGCCLSTTLQAISQRLSK
jgi:hypothetical protein